MARIVAGRFDNITDADTALAALHDAGFAANETTKFYTPPPGQHDIYPVGGDTHADKRAEDIDKGALAGAAIGGGAGLAAGAAAGAAIGGIAGPIGAIAGAGVGAYVGSLHGGMSQAKSANEEEATPERPVERVGGGTIVAALAARDGAEERAELVLARNGALQVVHADGEWSNGEWRDFDPRLPAEPGAAPTQAPLDRPVEEQRFAPEGVPPVIKRQD